MSELVEKVDTKMDELLSKISSLHSTLNTTDVKLSKLEKFYTEESTAEIMMSPMRSMKLSSLIVDEGGNEKINMTAVNKALKTWMAETEKGNRRWKKIFAHDTSGGLYADLEAAMNKNPRNEKAKLYSILDQLERFRDPEGNFHLKVCYPEVKYTPIYPCNEWIQSSNPLHESTITGFKAKWIAFPKTSTGGTFSGLGLSPQSFGSTLIDETPSHGYWYFAIGALQYWHKNDTIPGPWHGEADLAAVKRVNLFAKIAV